jgi:hypothetical protein
MIALLHAYLPVALLLAMVFVYAGVAAGSNAYQIGKDYDVSHLWETRERLVTVLGFVLLAFLPDLLHGRYAMGALSMVLGVGAAACLFGLRFDIRLNLRRLLDRYYIGTDPETAAQDKKARALGITGKQFAMAKLAGLLACVVALIFLRR